MSFVFGHLSMLSVGFVICFGDKKRKLYCEPYLFCSRYFLVRSKRPVSRRLRENGSAAVSEKAPQRTRRIWRWAMRSWR
ncbi:Protein of unknown function [Gryllus bimaculatus]|nr:Protein of unknown function [Gryllus bimaculatus]